MQVDQKILFSGIQPSGDLHIGQYVGAVKNWLRLQTEYSCLFSIVDLHAITVKQDPKILAKRCYDMTAMFIACGIDYKQHLIFIQSHVPAHAQLTWLLNCITYMGELNRMTQYKDKSAKQTAGITAGLFDYPVLQAADILLYNTHVVPVGEDQKQHLELVRNLAQRFNQQYKQVFMIPEPIIPQHGARIMALQDPSTKMSKSDVNQNNWISLLDSADVITRKIKRAVTDSHGTIVFAEQRPGICNLITLYSSISNENLSDIENKYSGKGYAAFKTDLAELVVNLLAPIQQRYYELRADEAWLNKVLGEAAAAADFRAQKQLRKVHDCIGLVPLMQNE